MKRTLAILLVTFLALPLVACGGNNTPATSSGPAATTAAQSAPAASAAASSAAPVEPGERAMSEDNPNMYAEGFPVLKEKKTYRIAVNKDANSQNGFADKDCTKMTEEFTNIHIDWTDIPSANWKDQYNIMFATGDLPDAFCGNTVDTMKYIDMLTPLRDIAYKYAPNVVEMFDGAPDILKAITAPDGDIYSFPTNKDNPTDLTARLLWLNGEWVEQLGLKMPETTDELYEVLVAFRDNDPNGNGKKDEIPLLTREINELLGPFGAVDTADYVYSVDGNTVIFSALQDGYFEGLKWLHKLYSEGLLDSELFTMDAAGFNAKAQAPDLAVGAMMYWIPDAIDLRYEDYVPMQPMKGPDGTQMYNRNRKPLGNMQGYTVTTACEEPEVLVRYYDACMSSYDVILQWQWGPVGAGCWKELEPQGAWTQTMEFLPEGMSQEQFKRTNCGSVNSPNYLWSKYTSIEVPDKRNSLKREGDAKCLPFAVTVMPNGLTEPEKAEARSNLFVDIDNYMKKFKATAVVDGIDEAGWQNHLQQCEKLRVGEYVEMWQEFYDRNK